MKKQLVRAIYLTLGVMAAGNALYGQTSKDRGAAVKRAVIQAEQAKASKATLTFELEKKEYLERRVRFRPGKTIRVLKNTETKETVCSGVLLSGTGLVATSEKCTGAADGFKVKQVTLAFSNGKRGIKAGDAVSVRGEFAFVEADGALTAGLLGADVAPVQKGQELKDAYGGQVSSAIMDFFVSRGVVSSRVARMTGRKPQLLLGEPFFYKGRLVALCKEVPSRAPVTFLGGVSEEALALFRAENPVR